MEFYFDGILKEEKLQLLVIQMLIGVEIRKIKEAQLIISFKYLVSQSHGARESNQTLSSCETEYIVESFVACQAIWIRSILEEIKVELKKPMMLQIDNKSVINLAKNPVLHGRSKHIEARCHFLRKKVNQGELKVKYCLSEAQLTDIFTKGLKINRFLNLRKNLGIVEINYDQLLFDNLDYRVIC